MSIGKYSTIDDVREIYWQIHELYLKVHSSMLYLEDNKLGAEIERLDLSMKRTLIYLSDVLEDDRKAFQEEPYHVGQIRYCYNKKEGEDSGTCKKE